jgi:hypothetical protein
MTARFGRGQADGLKAANPHNRSENLMTQQETQNKKAEKTKPKRGLRWWAGMALLAVAVAMALLWLTERLTLRSVDERLAAIEAARAIPDSENAAVIYDRLMKDYGRSQVPWGVVNNDTDTTTKQPWTAEDNPQLAAWLSRQQDLIAGLLEAATKEQCRFAITGYPEKLTLRHEQLNVMTTWASLLLRAGNNDIAEDRIDSGVQKYLAAVAMGRHVAQQPVIEYGIVGMAMESWPLTRMRRFIVAGPFTNEHLRKIESTLPPVDNNWTNFSRQTAEVDNLYRKKQNADVLARISRLFGQKPYAPDLQTLHEVYLRLLASRRGTLILIALRRHKDTIGQWPKHLEQISTSLPKDALIDPVSGDPFVYRLTDDDFTLFSTGRNRIDEQGQYWGAEKGKPDDLPVWPPWSRMIQQNMSDERQRAKPDD